MHPAAYPLEQLLSRCEFTRTRRRGPGGQHRNKVETAVVVTHTPSGIRAEANEERSQALNRARAIHRLRVNLALSVRQPLDSNEPSASWRARVKARTIHVNPDHADFPAILAECLDVLASESWRLDEAATRLGVTSSQIVKLLQLDRRGLDRLNQERAAMGLRRLR